MIAFVRRVNDRCVRGEDYRSGGSIPAEECVFLFSFNALADRLTN